MKQGGHFRRNGVSNSRETGWPKPVKSAAGLTTSDLIRELTYILKPDRPDAKILAGRNDTYFSQKVRNLVSHRTLDSRGLETYDAVRQHHAITPAGRTFLAEARERGEVAQILVPGPTLPPPEVFPEYRPAEESPSTHPREPFSVDPNEVDRALAAHAATQCTLRSPRSYARLAR